MTRESTTTSASDKLAEQDANGTRTGADAPKSEPAKPKAGAEVEPNQRPADQSGGDAR